MKSATFTDAVNVDELGVKNDPRNYARDRPSRSTRNKNPNYKLDQTLKRTMNAFQSRSKRSQLKKITPKRYELISQYLKNVALKNPAKYGGTGAGMKLWKEELLEMLNKLRSTRGCITGGAITSEDLGSWLKVENLATLVNTLKESTKKPGSSFMDYAKMEEDGPLDLSNLSKGSVSSSSASSFQDAMEEPMESESYIRSGAVVNINALSLSHEEGSPLLNVKRLKKVQRPIPNERPAKVKKLTPLRSQVIRNFFTRAIENPAQYYGVVKEVWIKELLAALNNLPYCRRPGRAIRDIDLKKWLETDKSFIQMCQELELLQQSGTRVDNESDDDGGMEQIKTSSSKNVSSSSSSSESLFIMIRENEKPSTSAQALATALNQSNTRNVSSKVNWDSDTSPATIQQRNPKFPQKNGGQRNHTQKLPENTEGMEETVKNAQLTVHLERIRRIRQSLHAIMNEFQEMIDDGQYHGSLDVARNMVNMLESFVYFYMNPEIDDLYHKRTL